MKRACKTALGLLVATIIVTTTTARAEGVRLIEGFEDYTDGVGDWVISSHNHINVALGLNLTSPVVGVKDLRVNLGVALLGADYTLSNSNLNIPMPASADKFSFKVKPLLALNVARSVVVTLRDQSNVSHVSDTKVLGVLTVGTVTDLDFDLDSFTPPIDGGVTAINGVDLKFSTGLASVIAEEHLDELRLLWDNSAVTDWMCY